MVAPTHLHVREQVKSDECQWFLAGCVEKNAPLQQISINQLPFTIGRRPDLNLTLHGSNVSKLHAELLAVGASLFVRDLQSTNGTYVNGRRIQGDTPIAEGDLLQFANFEFRVGQQRAVRTDRTMELDSLDGLEGGWMLTQFDKLLNERGVIPFFQPIVAFADLSVVGYEVLARSNISGLQNPREMFDVASRLDLEADLSALCRERGVELAPRLQGRPNIFMNTHPAEDLMQDVLPSLHQLRKQAPELQITLEIHEGAVTSPEVMSEFRTALHALDIKLAYDDFGSGQARLLDLAKVPPDYLKFDIGFIRGIHQAPHQQQQLVQKLVGMVRDFGIAALAEGIECQAESDVCRQLGFTYAQGYFFGRPAPVESFEK